jgi:4-alpha-glucanotransferase
MRRQPSRGVAAAAAADPAAADAPAQPQRSVGGRRTSTSSRRASSTASKAPQQDGAQAPDKQRPPRRAATTASKRPAAPAKKRAAAAAAAGRAPPLDAAPLGGRLAPAYSSGANMPSWQKGRRAGVILHPTSLPGGLGVGDLGPGALAFVDWLRRAGASLWQVLPLVPPDPEFFSPYSGLDANCGNPLLVSCDALATEGLLSDEDLGAARAELAARQAASPAPPSADAAVDFSAVAAVKAPLLAKAARALLSGPRFQALRDLGFRRWRRANPWVEDSALFDCLRRRADLEGQMWWEWPRDLRFREPGALEQARRAHRREIDEFAAVQFLFDRQWAALKAYANSRGVGIVGDMPIYVGGMSADVWANPGLFELDAKTLAPRAVSGVPPDAFSATGQLWGSPLYRWPAHAKDGYAWWSSRMARHTALFDETRVDHFRAFAGYWAVDAAATTAMGGEWRKGPGRALFDALERRLGKVPILAEDLGVITTDVVELR